MAGSAGGAMVIVNTVVIVQSNHGLTQQATALALAAFGGGSMIAAFVLPRLLESVRDRTTMLCGCAVLASGLLSSAFAPGHGVPLAPWLLLGIGSSPPQPPSRRLRRR